MRIRVTLEKDGYTGWSGQQHPGRTQVIEFDDLSEAQNSVHRRLVFQRAVHAQGGLGAHR